MTVDLMTFLKIIVIAIGSAHFKRVENELIFSITVNRIMPLTERSTIKMNQTLALINTSSRVMLSEIILKQRIRS